VPPISFCQKIAKPNCKLRKAAKNIGEIDFFLENELSSFSLITFGFVIFGTKILCEKCARKTLMKLTP